MKSTRNSNGSPATGGRWPVRFQRHGRPRAVAFGKPAKLEWVRGSQSILRSIIWTPRRREYRATSLPGRRLRPCWPANADHYRRRGQPTWRLLGCRKPGRPVGHRSTQNKVRDQYAATTTKSQITAIAARLIVQMDTINSDEKGALNRILTPAFANSSEHINQPTIKKCFENELCVLEKM